LSVGFQFRLNSIFGGLEQETAQLPPEYDQSNHNDGSNNQGDTNGVAHRFPPKRMGSLFDLRGQQRFTATLATNGSPAFLIATHQRASKQGITTLRCARGEWIIALLITPLQ
jgi:hypothetical protein